MRSYDETLDKLLSAVPSWDRVERVALSVAKDKILSADVVASSDNPLYKTSAMDGYAIKFEDQDKGKLRILGLLPAGTSPKDINLKSGECLKTFTGSLLCQGSDTLIPIENVKVNGEFIEIISKVKKEFAVRQVGESYKKGEILMTKGTKLGFSELGALAELGYSYVDVFMRPKVAVLCTGSEIVDLGQNPVNQAQIYSSNSVAIANLVSSMACDVCMLPVIKDDENLIKNTIKQTLKSVDFLITTGGVSVGDFDFMRDFVREFDLIVDKAAIKPGRHIKVARIDEKFIFALPGFPYSAITTCLLYFREFIYKLLGMRADFVQKAVLANDYTKKSDLQEFATATLTNQDGTLYISTANKKVGSSAIISNLMDGAVLLIAPASKNELKKGEVVEFLSI